MGFDEIRKRNAQRKQEMQSRSGGMFVRFVNDQDTMVVKLAPPFEGYYRLVKTMNGDMKEKLHYRMHIIGDYNFYTRHPLSSPPLEMTVERIRTFKDEDAKIWTTPYNAVQGIHREVDREHSILQIRRDGVAKSTNTTYNILNTAQIANEDWNFLLPKISREGIEKLQSEEQWRSLSDEELNTLQNSGVKDE